MNEIISTFAIWSPGAFVMGLLIIGSGFFSGSETALFYLSREELRRLQSGSASARLAAAMMKDPDRLLTVVLFWNLVINLTYFTVSIVTAKQLVDAGHSTIAGGMSIAAVLGLILFGEVVPKSVAVTFRRPIAIWTSWPLAISVRILSPILPILGATTRGLKRAMFPHLKNEPYLEVDDIERAIDSSQIGQELIQLEQKILGRILDLSEMSTEELMRPRGTYSFFQMPLALNQIKELDPEFQFLLLAETDSETITKALPLGTVCSLPQEHLESIAENVVYVPWCGKVSETLSAMRNQLVSVAVVLNEYGETIGVITEDDIVDTLFNPDSSRARRLLDREPVRKLGARRYRADGVTTLRYLGEQIGFDFEPRDDGLLTVTALLHEKLERFPEVGDECDWNGYRFRVIQAGGPSDSIQVEVTWKEKPQRDVPPER